MSKSQVTPGKIGLVAYVLRRRKSLVGLHWQAICTLACVKVDLYVNSKGHGQPSGKSWCHLWCFGWACLPQAHVFEYMVPSYCNCSRRIRGCGLLEEVYHWGGLCGFRRLQGRWGASPICLSLPPACGLKCELSAIPAAIILIKCFLLWIVLVIVFCYKNRKIIQHLHAPVSLNQSHIGSSYCPSPKQITVFTICYVVAHFFFFEIKKRKSTAKSGCDLCRTFKVRAGWLWMVH